MDNAIPVKREGTAGVPVARFVTRGFEESDGLLIGSLLTSGKGLFKPGTVYEIQEVAGELMIREVGPSAIQKTMPDYWDKPYNLGGCWGNSVGTVLNCAGRFLCFSDQEMAAEVQAWDAERIARRSQD